MMKKLIIFLLMLVSIYGCRIEEEKTNADNAAELCIAECKSRLQAGEDFSNGPCLSNVIIEDWVCDVAHKPRQDIDNQPENQCSAFRAGQAHHFVELNINCDIIKIY